jgi:hypothetical protein
MRAAWLIAAVAVLAPVAAYADDVTAAVRGIDTSGHKIGLDNGKIYDVLPEIVLSNLKPGDKVTVSYNAADAVQSAQGVAGVVTKITPSK